MNIIIIITAVLTALFLGHTFCPPHGKRTAFYLSIPIILFSSCPFAIHAAPLLTTAAAIWGIVTFRERDTLPVKVIFPAIFAGLALQFDLRLFPVLIPAILAIIFFSPSEKIKKISLFLGLTPLFFLLLTPISIYIAFPYKIIDAVAPYTAPLTLTHYIVISAAAIWGAVLTWKKGKQEALLVFSFPAVIGIYALMSGTVPIIFWQPWIVALAACGIGDLCISLFAKLSGIAFFTRPWMAISAAILIILAVSAVLLPFFGSLHQAANLFHDNRKALKQKISGEIPAGASIISPDILNLDYADLSENYHFSILPADQFTTEEIAIMDILLNQPFFIIPETRAVTNDRIALARLQSWRALKNKVNTVMRFPGQPLLLDYYHPVPWGSPAFSAGKLKPEFQFSRKTLEFNPWKRGAGKNRGLKIFSQLGEFEINAIDKNKRTISIRSKKADKDNYRKITIGYLTDDVKSIFKTPAGQWVYVSIDLAIKNASLSTGCALILRDKDAANTWETTSLNVPLEKYWTMRVISKKLRPSAKFMLIGVSFNALSEQETLLIRGIRIVSIPQPQDVPLNNFAPAN